ncbi:MAG TPA: PTS sugar transporter subunit IIA [Spirochaetia bacterium]|nr:PTS sugar transporter subunit IIA [Spirochaetia bacterium]
MVEEGKVLLVLAEVVLAGLVGGQIAHMLKLPHVTGQILIGILIGQAGLTLFGPAAVHGLDIVTQFALGMIALTVGEHLNIRALRNAGKRLFILLLTESILTPVIVFAVAYFIHGTPWLPLLLAAIAVSTAPATIVALVKETRSKGVFVKTLGAAVALNNIACVILFAVARSASRFGMEAQNGRSFFEMLSGPGAQIGLSILLGVAGGLVLMIVTQHVHRSERLAAFSLIALLVVTGAAIYFRLSLLLSCLFLGFTIANVTAEKKELGGAAFESIETAIYAAFFTLAGMEMDFKHIGAAGLLAAGVLAARFGSKLLSANLAMRFAGATNNVRRYLGFALIPQAGVAIGLILLIQQDPAFASLRSILLAVGLTTVMGNELIGSLTASFALKRSGDAGKDRPRLIDFIQEQNIVTNISAKTKEGAIAKLTDVLIQTNRLEIDRNALLKTFLLRESEASTCVGSGLAIPHGILPEGEEMCGVMGISREGMPFDTPDGIPVHCMVLLATPESQRERHLEVIAALARAIGRDHNIQEQLFNAETPAHAYEILHAEEAADFNYYLTEA